MGITIRTLSGNGINFGYNDRLHWGRGPTVSMSYDNLFVTI